VIVGGKAIYFDAFIDATGQETLSATDLPFPTLVAQGGVRKSTTPKAQALVMGNEPADVVRTGGLDVDEYYRPNLAEPLSNRLYCAAIAFLLHKQPFVQGITSACEIGETVASALLADVEQGERPALLQLPA
jgi:hypothetical protein